ncbi:retrovirus-related pol polyprotein from transposon TNT 1-94 [Tanacetum coccineum]|uniref:Retrovirus-related pol polyprotein from transposon TNT 1-94 n=1 Tax=Tanacetum coccineum TaxID=301880 RepID=A0ABQ4Z029_9ASTR
MNNDPFFGIPIPENDSEASTSLDVIPTVVHTAAPNSEHVNKWTKDHPLDNIIGELERPVSTRLKLYEQALFCNGRELMNFDVLNVESFPRPDKVMVITLKWIYKIKLDEIGRILKNKARSVARGYRQEESLCQQRTGLWIRQSESWCISFKKALYGLKQALRAWYDLLSKFLLSQVFSKGTVDPHVQSEDKQRYFLGTLVSRGFSIALTASAVADHAGCQDNWKSTYGCITMDITRDQQIALDDALVAHANRLKIGKSYQITADVPEIYMQEFWATATVHHHSIRFKMNNKKHIMNLEYFIEMLQICPKLPYQQFKELPFEEAILTFLRELGHSGEIKVITDVNVNKLHQPWRSFVAVISKCLSGKSTGYDSLRLSQAQILWGMYHKKNTYYAYLMWEDFVYQVENKNVRRSNEMYYPRFTKVIVNFFMTKDSSIPRRNRVNWHFSRDDPMFTTIKVVSRHEDTQLYGAILPNELTNEAIKDSESYKEYYVIASGAEPPKTKASVKKKQNGSDKTNTPPTAKGKRLKTSEKAAKPAKKKQHVKTSKAKVLSIPSSSLQNPPNFGSLFGFDHRLKTLETDFSEFKQTNQFAVAVSLIPGIVDAYLANKMREAVKTAVQLQSDRLRDEAQAENEDFINKLDDNIKKIIKDQVKEQVKAQVSKILPKIKKTVNEQLEVDVLTRSSNESKTSHVVAANLSELELKKILIDKMESNKSIHRSDEQKNLYKALDKDKEPSAGSNRGSKRRRARKEPESTSAPKEKTSKTTGMSTKGSKSHHKSAGESAQAEEPMHTAKDLEEPAQQEFETGVTEDQPDEETSQLPDWF